MDKCYVCGGTQNLNEHHINMVALGGSIDGPLIFLCVVCHLNVHTAARRVYAGKHNFIELFKPGEFERAKLLIQAIVSDMIKLESSERPPSTIRRLQLSIPQNLHLALHRAKKDAGFTNLQKYIIAVLEHHVKHRS